MAAAFEIELTGTVSGTPAQVWSLLRDHQLVAAWLGAADNGARVKATSLEPPRRLEVHIEDPTSLLRSIEVAIEIEPARHAGETSFQLRAICRPRRFAAVLNPMLRLRAEVLLHRTVRELRSAVSVRFSRERGMSRPMAPGMGWRDPATDGTRLPL